MGAAAAARAELLVVTDDNPRTEDPAAIRAAMLAGARGRARAAARCCEIGDRRAAIAAAVGAGPGPATPSSSRARATRPARRSHGVKHPFDDAAELAAATGGRLQRAAERGPAGDGPA